MEGQTILVTGGAGFIGSHLADSFQDDNTVRILDTAAETESANQTTTSSGDIRDEATVSQVTADSDVIFHEAALVSVTESITDPRESHTINATGTLNVLEAARTHDARVVFASSAAIYGQPQYTPIDESHPKEPTSPYGLDKLSGDHYMRLYAEQYGLETVALRYFNVYGPGQVGEYAGVITVFIEQALNDEPITVNGDGSQTRDFVFIEDVVQANRLAATTDQTGKAYNIGTGRSITIRKLAELVQDITGTDADIVHIDPSEGDIQDSQADISNATRQLDYEPSIPLREGLERTVSWYKSQS